MAGKKRRRLSATVPAWKHLHAGQQLLSELKAQYCTGAVMNARNFCVLCHLAAAAGALGPVSDWGLPPDDVNTGQYQRKIFRKMEAFKKKQNVSVDEMILSVPGHPGIRAPRGDLQLKVRPFHESLFCEVMGSDDSTDRQRQLLLDKPLPPVYFQHPVVEKASEGELVIPMGLYVDAARYGGNASAGRSKSVL
eukprot:5309134-Pyramimonas_sp.AAC.1